MARGKGGGRRPLPTSVKKLRGNPGHRPLNNAEPKPTRGAPDMPAGLVGEAKAEWDRIIPELELAGLITKIDRAALAAYCFCYAEWFSAKAELDTMGRMIKEPIVGIGDNGPEVIDYKFKKNPLCAEVWNGLRLMKAYLVEFGLTPSSRSRIKVEAPEQEEDALDALLRKQEEARGPHARTKPN